jgi:hypothetical protein
MFNIQKVWILLAQCVRVYGDVDDKQGFYTLTLSAEWLVWRAEINKYSIDTFQYSAIFFKLQRLQNKALRTMRGFPKCLPIRDLHVALKIT